MPFGMRLTQGTFAEYSIDGRLFSMKLHELNFPVVFENGRQVGYGGDQDWFPAKFQQMAGCASTSAANLAAYYAANFPRFQPFYKGSTGPFTKAEYLAAMEELYRYMTPGFMGFPVISRFAKKFIQFAKDHGHTLEAHILKEKDPQTNIDFVKKAIEENVPVALLILRHRAPELLEDNWHWVTITGWIEDEAGEKIIFSDCGNRDIHPMEVLFEPHNGNVFRMVRFTEKTS